MRQLLRTMLRLNAALRRIKSMDLEEGMKSQIRNAYLRAILLRRYDKRNNIANIFGCNVKFCTYESFSYLFNEIFIDQEYYFVTDKQNPLIVDCGSNIGMSILYFKMVYPTSVILAFEPDKDAFSCLESNIRDNGLQSVCANKKALWSNEGPIDLYYDHNDPGSLGMSVIAQRIPKEKQVVEGVRLSRYIEGEVDFLKVDVEGAERDIIEELRNAGRLSYVRQMCIEFHHHIVKNADALSAMLLLLEDAGFGYQIEGNLERPFKSQRFQDILIYAYRKDDTRSQATAAEPG
jgi:FkbM family methyltransferase